MRTRDMMSVASTTAALATRSAAHTPCRPVAHTHCGAPTREFTSGPSSDRGDAGDASDAGTPLWLDLDCGLRFGALTWGDPSSKHKVLALHGWLDNAASMQPLASALARLGCHVVAIDFAGHGLSDHRPRPMTYTHPENAFNVVETMDALGWDGEGENGTVLVGHSMGGGLSVVVAGAVPDRIRACVLIDSVGLFTVDEGYTAEGMREGMASNKKMRNLPTRVIPSLAAAIRIRQKGAEAAPGDQSISYEGARAIISRGTRPATPAELRAWDERVAAKAEAAKAAAAKANVGAGAGASGGDSSVGTAKKSLPHIMKTGPGTAGGFSKASRPPSEEDVPARFARDKDSGPVVFTHDTSLQSSSLLYFSEPQMQNLIAAYKGPSLVLTGTSGWHFDPEKTAQRHSKFHDLTLVTVEGSHHMHLDAHSRDVTRDHILRFLIERVGIGGDGGDVAGTAAPRSRL